MFNLFRRKNLGPGQVRIEPLGKEFAVPREQSILEAALEAGIAFPHSCKVGTCTTCRCVLRSGAVKAIRDFSYALSGDELQAGYILACQAKVKSAQQCVLEVYIEPEAPAFAAQTVETSVESKRLLAGDILELNLRAEKHVPFVAGQYAELKLPALDRARALSFACAPSEGGCQELRFIVRRVAGGEFTGWLFDEAKPGDRITLSSPYGSFWLREGNAPLVCVAGGSGLAPILSILKAALESGVSRDITLLFGARRQGDLYAIDEIKGIAESWPAHFTFLPVLSDEPEASDWTGLRGLVTQFLSPSYVEDIPSCHAYLCGPPAMIDAAVPDLLKAGIGSKDIHYDKFLDASDLARAGASGGAMHAAG